MIQSFIILVTAIITFDAYAVEKSPQETSVVNTVTTDAAQIEIIKEIQRLHIILLGTLIIEAKSVVAVNNVNGEQVTTHVKDTIWYVVNQISQDITNPIQPIQPSEDFSAYQKDKSQ